MKHEPDDEEVVRGTLWTAQIEAIMAQLADLAERHGISYIVGVSGPSGTAVEGVLRFNGHNGHHDDCAWLLAVVGQGLVECDEIPGSHT